MSITAYTLFAWGVPCLLVGIVIGANIILWLGVARDRRGSQSPHEQDLIKILEHMILFLESMSGTRVENYCPRGRRILCRKAYDAINKANRSPT